MAQELIDSDLYVAGLFVAETDGKAWTAQLHDEIELTPGGVVGDRHNAESRTVHPYESAGFRGTTVENDRAVSVGDADDMEAIAASLGLLDFEAEIREGENLSPGLWLAAQLAVNVVTSSQGGARLNQAVEPGTVVGFGSTPGEISAQLRMTSYNPACRRPARAMLAAARRLGIDPWPLRSGQSEQDRYVELGERFIGAAQGRRGWVASVRSREDPRPDVPRQGPFTVSTGQRLFVEHPCRVAPPGQRL